jgi:microcystin-dependent protein
MAGPSGSTPKLALPYPVSADTVDVPRDILALATKLDNLLVPSADVPTGAIMMWPTAAPPAGWYICNGSTSTATSAANPNLAALLGTTGAYVNLPDYRGVMPMGVSASHPLSGAGSSGGTETETLSTAQIPSHTHADSGHSHPITDKQHSHTSGGGNFATYSGAASSHPWFTAGAGSNQMDFLPSTDPAYTGITGTNNGNANLQNTGGGGSHNNLPPYKTINFIIKGG